MASEQGHTARDWRLCEMVETERGRVWGINGFVECGMNQPMDCRLAEVFSNEDHAAFIVRAVNCHEDLVNALERLIHPDGGEEDDIRAARAILAKAQS